MVGPHHHDDPIPIDAPIFEDVTVRFGGEGLLEIDGRELAHCGTEDIRNPADVDLGVRLLIDHLDVEPRVLVSAAAVARKYADTKSKRSDNRWRFDRGRTIATGNSVGEVGRRARSQSPNEDPVGHRKKTAAEG